MDYGSQLYNTTFAVRLKNLDSIHREGMKIFTGAFRTTSVEALHVEANDPLLELRKNELELKFLYKLKSNTSYIETLNKLDDREDQNYEENERSIKPTGVFHKKTGTKIYGRTEGDRRDELDIATPMVGKRHNILL